jgi:hypothetical protein
MRRFGDARQKLRVFFEELFISSATKVRMLSFQERKKRPLLETLCGETSPEALEESGALEELISPLPPLASLLPLLPLPSLPSAPQPRYRGRYS